MQTDMTQTKCPACTRKAIRKLYQTDCKRLHERPLRKLKLTVIKKVETEIWRTRLMEIFVLVRTSFSWRQKPVKNLSPDKFIWPYEISLTFSLMFVAKNALSYIYHRRHCSQVISDGVSGHSRNVTITKSVLVPSLFLYLYQLALTITADLAHADFRILCMFRATFIFNTLSSFK